MSTRPSSICGYSRIAVDRLEWFQTLGRLLCYVDFSLCANRNRIPNDPVASKDRRQGTPCGPRRQRSGDVQARRVRDVGGPGGLALYNGIKTVQGAFGIQTSGSGQFPNTPPGGIEASLLGWSSANTPLNQINLNLLPRPSTPSTNPAAP